MPPDGEGTDGDAHLLAVVLGHQALRNAHRVEPGSDGPRGGPSGRRFAVDCEVDSDSGVARLRIVVRQAFPPRLPDVYLVNAGDFDSPAHVEADGRVCYVSQEGLSIDLDAPELVLAEAIQMAVDVVLASVSGSSRADIIEELDAYSRQAGAKTVLISLVEPTAEMRSIVSLHRKGKTELVADSEEAAVAFQDGLRGASSTKALYIPLPNVSDACLLDPRRLQEAGALRTVVERSLTRPEKKRLRRLLAKKASYSTVVVAPVAPSGGRALIAFRRVCEGRAHPLSDERLRDRIEPVDLRRADRTHLITRGGASLRLAGARVALVGCGAVGGPLALALAAVGVGKIDLFDPDLLWPENIYRHILGKSALGKQKAVALAHDIAARYPYLEVRGWPKSAEDAV